MILQKMREEIDRLESVDIDLYINLNDALSLAMSGEHVRAVALFIQYQMDIIKIEVLRNLIADYIESVLDPQEKEEEDSSIPVILEYKDKDGNLVETQNFTMERANIKKVRETVFHDGSTSINEFREGI